MKDLDYAGLVELWAADSGMISYPFLVDAEMREGEPVFRLLNSAEETTRILKALSTRGYASELVERLLHPQNSEDDFQGWSVFDIITPEGVKYSLAFKEDVLRFRHFPWKPVEVQAAKNKATTIQMEYDTALTTPEGSRVELLEQQIADIAKWQAEGEGLLEGKGGLMFSLGVWWADRPWRTDRHNAGVKRTRFAHRLNDGLDGGLIRRLV